MAKATPTPQAQFLRLAQLKQRLSVSPASIWNWTKAGTFPKPIKLSANTTAWHITDIEQWEAARIQAAKGGAQ